MKWLPRLATFIADHLLLPSSNRCTLLAAMLCSSVTLHASAVAQPARVLIVVGPTDHPPGTHEVASGGRLMKHCLETMANVPGVKADVVYEWPSQTLRDGASTVVFIGDTFPANRLPNPAQNLADLDAMMRRGCGIVCVHYATGLLGKDVTPKGDHPLLRWVGGYFANRSCKHHESFAKIFPAAKITAAAPQHPVARGWREFTVNDEPYTNNYFGPGNQLAPNVTTFATSLLPPNAPKVETVAWGIERADGGRGFAIVMPHFYKNWRQDDLRRFILNGIVWTAKLEVPAEGVQTATPDLAAFAPVSIEPQPWPKKVKPESKAEPVGGATGAHLEIPVDPTAKSREISTTTPATQQNIIVYKEPGRYGGWPANQGMWQWDDELVVGFTATYYKETTTDHRIDRTKPSHRVQARSLDGGKTWRVEADQPYSDRKNEPEAVALKEPLDFTALDFAMMFRFKSLHTGPSWFYTTHDRCKSWQGPFKFDVEGVDGISTRTDLIPISSRDCLMFGSCGKKSDNKEGRVFCARTTDGGLTWKLQGYIGEEPPKGGFAIMPSTVRTAAGALLTTIRMGKPSFTIQLWCSDDLGKSWSKVSDVTGNIGGNPPATVLLPDGRLCVTYGYRKKPTGIRARLSSDEGKTWTPEIILRDDGFDGDLGYPRTLVRPDGRVLTVYYFNGPRGEDRAIEGTFWTPPAAHAH
jgi:type 1 glutamine amidotransferase